MPSISLMVLSPLVTILYTSSVIQPMGYVRPILTECINVNIINYVCISGLVLVLCSTDERRQYLCSSGLVTMVINYLNS